MLERISASATKKERVAQRNEQRLKRQEEGYRTPDSSENQDNRKIGGKQLLLQQKQYDSEMEYQFTEKNAYARTSQEMVDVRHRQNSSNNYTYLNDQQNHHDSIISSVTDLKEYHQRKVIIKTGLSKYDQVRGHYDLNNSNDSDDL